MTENVLMLNKGADQRLRKGHCWVYSNEINTKKTPLKSFEPGEQVQLLTHTGQAFATCFVQPNALIAGRIISRNVDQWMDKSLLVHRFKVADSLRARVFGAPFYRLCFGDSDQLPGLVVDRFDHVLVVQISTPGMERLKDSIIEALCKVFKPETIVLKNNNKMRRVEGLDEYIEVAYGDQSISHARLVENGVRFDVPVIDGQKTGWFYDHRLNRARMMQYSKGLRVLDLFSYIGGWGIQAASAGAESVVCVDSSGSALESARGNANLNDVSNKVSYLKMDAFDACQQLKADREKFDLVIVDPPAFIARKKDIKAGEAAYQRINQLAMRLLTKDGLLISASCSMHLSQSRLVDILRSTSRATDRQSQILELGTQSPDHPILPAVPETHYIKSVFARILTGQA